MVLPSIKKVPWMERQDSSHLNMSRHCYLVGYFLFGVKCHLDNCHKLEHLEIFNCHISIVFLLLTHSALDI